MLKAVRDKKPQNAVAGTSRPPTTNPRLARLNNDIDVRPARSAPIKEEFTVGTDSEAIAKALPLALKRANGKSEGAPVGQWDRCDLLLMSLRQSRPRLARLTENAVELHLALQLTGEARRQKLTTSH